MEGEKKEWQNVCQMRKGGKMKSIIRFPGGTSLTFKELLFRGSCTSVPFHSGPSSAHKQQTVSEEPVSSLATASSLPHGFWIQWTWNESIQVSATVWKSMLEYERWKNSTSVSVGCCYANVCLNQCVPAGSSVTCCMRLVLMTSIRHDKLPPGSGMYIRPCFLTSRCFFNVG